MGFFAGKRGLKAEYVHIKRNRIIISKKNIKNI